MGYHRTFLGKARHMLGLAAEEALGDEEREIGVLHAGFLEHAVQHALHFFPYRIAVGLDYHTAANGRLFGQIRFYHDVIIPLGIVFRSRSYNL